MDDTEMIGGQVPSKHNAIAPPVAAGSVEWCNEVNMDGLREENAELRQRAEKAEAELAQVNEWRAAALASNQQMQELMTAKLAAAEARVSELEEENADLQLEMQDERQRHFD